MSRFHSHGGWYFEREDDGSVTITRRIPIGQEFAGETTWPVEHVRLDADTWASVVASVCAKGEDATTFEMAQRLHAGAKGLMRASITYGPDPGEPLDSWRRDEGQDTGKAGDDGR